MKNVKNFIFVAAFLCAVLSACGSSPAPVSTQSVTSTDDLDTSSLDDSGNVSRTSAPPVAAAQLEISTWDLTAKAGTMELLADLAIEKVTSNEFGSTFEGYIDWYYTGALLGREIFDGTYTSSSGKVNMQSTRIENGRRINGVSLGLDTYEAALSADGNYLTEGTLTGGTWEAAKRSSQ